VSAVAALARVEWRRSRRFLVTVAVLAGLAGGLVAGALTVARRTETAERRVQQASHVEDAQVRFLSGTPADQAAASRVAGLPEVREAWIADALIGRTAGKGVNYLLVAAGPARPPDLVTPLIVRGRAARAVDEIEVVEGFADAFRLGPGATVTVRLLTPAQAGSFQTGLGTPGGPTVPLRVTGIYRAAEAPQSLPIIGTPALADRYGSYAGGRGLLVRLQPGTRSRFAADVARVAGPTAIGVTYAADDARPVDATARVLSDGLLAFAVIVALGAAVAIGQALGRHADAAAADQRTEATLGLTTVQRTAGRTLPALVAAATAGVLTVGGALAGAVLAPPGVIGRVEPFPGWAPNAALVAVAAGATLLAVAGLAAWTAARAGRRHAAGRASEPRPLRLTGAWAQAGLRLGASRTRGARIGAIAGVAGVVAVVVFAASLHRLAHTPRRWGWNGQFEVVDARPPVLAELGADRRVHGLTAFQSNSVVVDGQEVEAYAERDIKGRAGWTVLDGRPPIASGEVLLGSSFARRWDLHGGDDVTVALPSGARRFRVVGTGVGPSLNNEGLGDAVVMTSPDLGSASRTAPFYSAVVDAPTGAGAIEQELAGRWELSPRTPPPEVTDLTALGRLPDFLALVLLVVALAAFTHGLLMTGTGRDLAVLRIVGLTRGQAAAAGVTIAVVVTCVGLALGVPIGAVAGRLVWWAVAQSHGVATDASIPVAAIAAVVPLAVAVGAGIGWLATRHLLRPPPSAVLRTE
jgi:putative ABC transport system permease protein